jgi:hypothetical protein
MNCDKLDKPWNNAAGRYNNKRNRYVVIRCSCISGSWISTIPMAVKLVVCKSWIDG